MDTLLFNIRVKVCPVNIVRPVTIMVYDQLSWAVTVRLSTSEPSTTSTREPMCKWDAMYKWDKSKAQYLSH